MKNFILFIIGSISIISCQVVNKSAQVKTANINGPKITQVPTLADLSVKETKVTGKSEGSSTSTLSAIKSLAVSDALKKSNADVLIEPRYNFLQTSTRITVEVSGYPASYKNFRPMEVKDTTLVQYSMMQYATGKVSTGSVSKSKGKPKAAKILVGSLVGIILMSMILSVGY